MAFLLAKPTPLNVNHGNDRFSMFNKKRDIPSATAPGQLYIDGSKTTGAGREPQVKLLGI